MARINTNVPALVAQRHLRRSQSGLELSLERLSSGLRINRGADDPAGLTSRTRANRQPYRFRPFTHSSAGKNHTRVAGSGN